MTASVQRATDSLWQSPAWPDLGPLTADADADVCVVGAGIAGLTTAYLLARAGRRVIVLEKDRPGSGETGATTAHLASAQDDRFAELVSVFGEDGTRALYQSHAAAIDRIEAIVRDEGIDCDFTRLNGYLWRAPDSPPDVLDRELDAARKIGFPGVEPTLRAPLPSFDTGPALVFPNQGQFEPMQYLAGLARAFLRHGGRIHVDTYVTTFEGGPTTRAVTKAGPAVRAKALVVATNVPSNDRVTMHTKIFPYRSYVIALKVPAGAIPPGLYWDTTDPYHYVRLQRYGTDEYLVVGGEDHKTGQDDDPTPRYDRLVAWTRERFPAAGEVVTRWSGQVIEPADGLAFIGRNPGDENVYIATGDSGQGMTHGTIAGMLLTDLILGRDNPWAALYDPARKPTGELREYLKENLNVAKYYGEWLTPGDVKSADAIPPGEGAVLREGLTKVACYKDASGALTRRSAVCPHLGCFVHWNKVEKSWDCPCHGSRFQPDGTVIHGPSISNLAPADKK